MASPETFADEVAAVAEVADRLSALVEELFGAGCSRFDPATVVELALRTIPGTRYADLLAWRHGDFATVAASPGFPAQLDSIRSAAGEGPCFEAIDAPTPVVSEDLDHDSRWPRFAVPAVASSEVRSLVSYRVHLDRHQLGALSCYSDWPFGFDELAVSTGKMVAACCTLAALTR